MFGATIRIARLTLNNVQLVALVIFAASPMRAMGAETAGEFALVCAKIVSAH
jgi:hypothetical protein